MGQNLKFSKGDGLLLVDLPVYQRLIARLLYLTITHPDLSYLMQALSQFMEKPTTSHLATTHKVLKYIKFAPGQGLLLSAFSNLQLTVDCDSDWASCQDTSRSITGYCVLLGQSLIS